MQDQSRPEPACLPPRRRHRRRKKERNYKHAAAVSSGSTLKNRPPVAPRLNDAGRTSGSLEGLGVLGEQAPPISQLQYGGIIEGVGDKQRQMDRLWQLVSSSEKRKHLDIISFPVQEAMIPNIISLLLSLTNNCPQLGLWCQIKNI